MTNSSKNPPFSARKHRKIMPFDAVRAGNNHIDSSGQREKAARLNQHRLGYGAMVEAEWRASAIPAPNLSKMRRYRLDRIRAELRQKDYAGVLLYDPVNIRYATDSTNMQVWVAHNPTRYCFVPTAGPVILFDYHGCDHLSDHSEVVDEVRPAVAFMYLYAGNMVPEHIKRWARDIVDVVTEHGAGNRRIAVDRLDPAASVELAKHGISVHGGDEIMERARLIKSPDEILCMRRAIVACQKAMSEMESMLAPGISENELWAELHRGNIARGGEWIETRLLTSGPRTNPWFQECSSRIIEAGDLVAFDTDLIGPYGYCVDISRTWLCGSSKPTNEQRDLYSIAASQVTANTEILRPGISLTELGEMAIGLPDDCIQDRYSCLYHGVGLADEYPAVLYKEDRTDDLPDDVLGAGVVLCVESYVGRTGGDEGVKLEQQVLITDTGYELLSDYPLDTRLCG